MRSVLRFIEFLNGTAEPNRCQTKLNNMTNNRNFPNAQSVNPISQKEWATMGYEKANEILSPMPLIERLEALRTAPSSMLPYEYWIKKSKSELMQWYMNALTTRSCLGHGKRRANDDAVEEYLELMKKYEVPVPPNNIAYILGEYNGEGSR